MTISTTVSDAGAGSSALPARKIRTWRISPSTAVGLFFTIIVVCGAVFAPLLTHADPLALSADSLLPPSLAHPMGTDDLGRDLFARVLYGGRVSLIVGLFSALISMALGMGIGLVAGFFGGAVDDALMRLTEMFQILPRLLVAIVVVALLGGSIVNVILVIGALSWPATARIIRSRVLVLRQEEFMLAAVMSGATWLRLILRHAMPNVFAYFLVSSTLQIASAVLSESFLSFLGLGDPQRPSWGLLLQQGQLYIQQAWWLTTFPGAMLAMTILGLNLLGDGLSSPLKMPGARR
jgi:peptide/nickel transport system permease protein